MYGKIIDELCREYPLFTRETITTTHTILMDHCDKNGFVVPLDDVVFCTGYVTGEYTMKKLIKKYVINNDYIICNDGKVLLTTECFQSFCMRARTKKADMFRQIYVETLKNAIRGNF
jgi:hypothetical protein